MVHKFSLLLNTFLSFIFIGIVTYQIIATPELDGSGISAVSYVLIVYPSFLWLNYICFKAIRAAKESAIAIQQEKTGKVLSIIVIIFAIVTIIFSLLALVPFLANQSMAKGPQLVGLIIVTIVSSLSAVTAIFNAVYYRKLVKQNKAIVNSVINTIGENTSQ